MRQLRPDHQAPPAFDDRSPTDVAIDTAAASLRGALMAVEAEFGSEMSITMEVLARTLQEFLTDVAAEADAETAHSYARYLKGAIDEWSVS